MGCTTSEIRTVVLGGARPSSGADVPADITDISRACWGGKPDERPTFRAVLEGMKSWNE